VLDDIAGSHETAFPPQEVARIPDREEIIGVPDGTRRIVRDVDDGVPPVDEVVFCGPPLD